MSRAARRGHVLVTGGAGFIGTNLADRLARERHRVVVFDSLTRPGTERNLEWLVAEHGDRVRPLVGDLRDTAALRRALAGATSVFHLAAQVAVTTSLHDPLDDFAVNLQATVTLLEELRRRPVPLLFTSTNKVYGALGDVALAPVRGRWLPKDRRLRESGVGESRPLDPCTPYGCSKAGADQYVLDYARTFGVPAVVFRMSCIYGPHQLGNEDQGWLAHFLKRALGGGPITIFGDGRQVRDVLHVSDLVAAMLLAGERAGELAGTPFNIGGGPASALSLRDLLVLIEELQGRPPEVQLAPERPGDQRWYVSDTARFRAATGWLPLVDPAEGVELLYRRLLGERAADETLARSAA